MRNERKTKAYTIKVILLKGKKKKDAAACIEILWDKGFT